MPRTAHCAKINVVDREQRIGGHQVYRDGLRPPERTCANAAERRNSSTTTDEARKPVIGCTPGNWIVTLLMPPTAPPRANAGARHHAAKRKVSHAVKHAAQVAAGTAQRLKQLQHAGLAHRARGHDVFAAR